MRRLLKRWYVWLGLALLLGFAGSVALSYSNQKRITQKNCDRIQVGMSRGEVEAILGKPVAGPGKAMWNETYYWNNGPSWIFVSFKFDFADEKFMVDYKDMHEATTWETLQWYAKKGAEKIGIQWD